MNFVLRCDILQKLLEIKIDHLDKINEDSNRLEQAATIGLDSVDSDTREAAQVNVYSWVFENDYDDESNEATNENDLNDKIVFYDSFVIIVICRFL